MLAAPVPLFLDTRCRTDTLHLAVPGIACYPALCLQPVASAWQASLTPSLLRPLPSERRLPAAAACTSIAWRLGFVAARLVAASVPVHHLRRRLLLLAHRYRPLLHRCCPPPDQAPPNFPPARLLSQLAPRPPGTLASSCCPSGRGLLFCSPTRPPSPRGNDGHSSLRCCSPIPHLCCRRLPLPGLPGTPPRLRCRRLAPPRRSGKQPGKHGLASSEHA